MYNMDRDIIIKINQGKYYEAYNILKSSKNINPKNYKRYYQIIFYYTFQMNYQYYIPMLNDNIRNTVFKKHILNTINKDDKVIDIGSGCGLLSYFASQKTKDVISIEIDPIILDISKQLFINNNLDIKTINKSILDVKVDDINGLADVAIIELVGIHFIQENIITYVDYVKKNLLKENGKIIPNKGKIFIVAVECDKNTRNNLILENNILEYDVSYLSNLFRDNLVNSKELWGNKNYVSNNVNVNDRNVRYLSEPKMFYEIDFNNLVNTNTFNIELDITRDGFCDGILVFFEVCLDNYVINTIQDKTHWTNKMYMFGDITGKSVNIDDKLNFNIEIKNNKFFFN